MSQAFKTLLLIFFIGGLAYSNSLHSPLLIDDHSFFERKIPAIKHLSEALFPYKTFPGSVRSPYFRPLSLFVPAVYYWIFHNNVFAYHGLNLWLFCLSAWGIYIFLRQRLQSSHISALLAAVFYLVHPINGLAVNYTTASVFSLEVMFMLAALYFLRNTALSCIFFLLAVFCHETAIMLPFYALALCCVLKDDLAKTKNLFITLGVYLVFRMFHASLQETVVDKIGLYHISFAQFLATATMLWAWYLSRLAWMQNIVLIMSHQPLQSGLMPWLLLFILLITLTGYLIWHYHHDRIKLLGLLWFITGFVPFPLMCTFQPVHGLMIEPHWFIFPAIGFFIFIASFSWRLPLLAAVIFFAVFFTRWDNWLWADEVRYCQFWLKESPAFVGANSFLAQGYEQRGQFDMARYYYDKVIPLGYNMDFIYESLGLMDLKERKWEGARKNFINQLHYTYGLSGPLMNNIGSALKGEGRNKEAMRYFAFAAQYSPDDPLPYLNAADIFLKLHKPQAAAVVLKQLLSAVPGQENAMVSLIQIYMTEHDNNNVIVMARQIEHYSRNPYSLRNAAILLYRSGLYDESREAFIKSRHIFNSAGNISLRKI